MTIRCVWEHNGDDTILYAIDPVGAFTRGKNKEEALQKMPAEVKTYLRWAGKGSGEEEYPVEIVEEQESRLQICDADSDVIFGEETAPLSFEGYLCLKELALKSASDFYELYRSVPDKDQSALPHRSTFYGAVPRTANEMYAHTKNVNAYYFGEIGIDVSNEGTILECRKRGFEQVEQAKDYLKNVTVCGSYDELWSLRKVLRRFIWHDRIHAKAMYRMAIRTFGVGSVRNVFGFVL